MRARCRSPQLCIWIPVGGRSTFPARRTGLYLPNQGVNAVLTLCGPILSIAPGRSVDSGGVRSGLRGTPAHARFLRLTVEGWLQVLAPVLQRFLNLRWCPVFSHPKVVANRLDLPADLGSRLTGPQDKEPQPGEVGAQSEHKGLLVADGKSHFLQEQTRLIIGLGSRADDNVHAPKLVERVVRNLGEDQLFLQAEGIVATSIKRLGR